MPVAPATPTKLLEPGKEGENGRLVDNIHQNNSSIKVIRLHGFFSEI
jgi:hypothetical protein